MPAAVRRMPRPGMLDWWPGRREHGMNTWLASTRDTSKTQLWPAPVIAVVAALLFGVGLPQLDATIDGNL